METTSSKIIINNKTINIHNRCIKTSGKEYYIYTAKITIGRKENGRQLQKEFTGKNEEEVIEKIRDYYKTPIFIPSKDYTIEEWMYKWLEDYGSISYRPSTISSRHRVIKNSIVPYIGTILISTLNEDVIMKFYSKLYERYKIAYVHVVHHVLSASFDYATKKRIIPYNYCQNIPLKRKEYKEPTYFQPNELQEYMHLIDNEPIFRNALALLPLCGLRIGECIGLSWDNVFIDAGYILIKQQYVHYHNYQTGRGEYHLQNNTKTGTERKVPLSQKAKDYLINQKSLQEKQKAEHNYCWKNEYNLVFTMEDGRHINTSTLERHFKAIAILVGNPKATPHSARHTAATAALALGNDMRAVQKFLGHSCLQTTFHYTHVTEDNLRKQADAIASYLENINK